MALLQTSHECRTRFILTLFCDILPLGSLSCLSCLVGLGAMLDFLVSVLPLRDSIRKPFSCSLPHALKATEQDGGVDCRGQRVSAGRSHQPSKLLEASECSGRGIAHAKLVQKQK
jgi:hypothetical protein